MKPSMTIPEEPAYWRNREPYIDAQFRVLRDVQSYLYQFQNDDYLALLVHGAGKENVSFPLVIDPEEGRVVVVPMVDGYVRWFRIAPPETPVRRCRIVWDPALIDDLYPQSRETVINASFSGAIESLRHEYRRAVEGTSSEEPEEIYHCMELLERRYEELCSGRRNAEAMGS